jgi:pyruvate formate lyase activating enzyme
MDTPGIVFDIQRFSIHDGPGIRTTGFLKGCPLRCPWCHNPESWHPHPQVLFYPDRCIGCGLCFDACPEDNALQADAVHRINREACTECGSCAEVCTAEALEICGKEMTVAQVLEEFEKDRAFYENSDGGVTVSGGEATVQQEFLISLLRHARERGLHTVLDTCGHANPETLRSAAQHVDRVLFDLKIMDPQQHREVVGADNERILQNLRMLDQLGVPIVIRVPLIPDLTDHPDNLHAIASLAAKLPSVQRVDLMRYNRLGESKWRRLGHTYPLQGVEVPNDERMEELRQLVAAYGLETTVQG